MRVGRKLQRALCLMTLLPLAGCGAGGRTYNQYYQLVKMAFHGSSVGISKDQAGAIPYASLGFRVDGSAQGLLVLATDTNGDLLWTSASRVVLLTRDGRILRSVGLPRDRTAMTPQQGTALPPLSDALNAPYRSSRVVDMPAIGAYGVTLNCMTAMRRQELVSILDTAIATTRVDETCQSQNPRWSFTDSYWLDRDTGLAWRSVQHLYPGQITVQTEIFRPPG